MQNKVGAALARARSTSAFSLQPLAFFRGFTLVELMIVMVVISVMVGFTIPISKYVIFRARQANQKIYIEKIKSALEDYRAAYGEYPITPSTNMSFGGLPDNYPDAVRHYPDHYATECFYTTNSPFTNVDLATNTVETMITAAGSVTIKPVDYCLTYPLMLRQRAEGTRPFMDFKEITVAFLIYHPNLQDGITYTRQRRTRSGGVVTRTTYGIYGNPVNRPKAIDPVSQNQWKYTSEDGVTYNLATNGF